MKPFGYRRRPRILTNYGRAVLVCWTVLLTGCALEIYHLLK